MRFCMLLNATTMSSDSTPLAFISRLMSMWHTRHRPVYARAISRSSSDSFSGGSSSQLCTSTLQAGAPKFIFFKISKRKNSGGRYAGWNVAKRSLQQRHRNTTIRDKIVCIACVAHNGASRSVTSYFAADTSSSFTGTTTTRS